MPPSSQLVKRWQCRHAKLPVHSVASPLAHQLEASRAQHNGFFSCRFVWNETVRWTSRCDLSNVP